MVHGSRRPFVRANAGSLASLAAALCFSLLYLRALGHLERGELEPRRLLAALAIAFAAIVAAALLAMPLLVSGAPGIARLARRAAAAVATLWIAAGAAVSLFMVSAGAPRDAIAHLIGSVTLLPAAVAGAAAFLLFEDEARDLAERSAAAAPAPGRSKLRVRLVMTIVTSSLLPLLLLAVAVWHFEQHGGQEEQSAHERGEGEAHAPLPLLLALVGGAAAAAGVGFGLLAARSLSRPILTLTSAMDRVRSGDLKTRAPILSEDEAGRASKAFNAMVEGLAERAWLRETFGRYVSHEVADALREGRIALQGEERVVTVLFADIRGFTQLSEALSPAEVLSFVNEYLRVMVDVVVKHHGRLDKVMGDGIMVVFGAPLADAAHARNAVSAALAMQEALEVFNAGRTSAGRNPIRIGIGIHTGNVVAGNVGVDSHKVEYTVLGDTVNLASRIESLTKELHADILITEATGTAAGEDFLYDAAREVSIRGKSAPVGTLTVRGRR